MGFSRKHATCLGEKNKIIGLAGPGSKLSPDRGPEGGGVAGTLRPAPRSSSLLRSTFVGSLHVLFVKHQVVALHCSRVELQPENHFPLRGPLALVVAFNLNKTKTTTLI